MNETPRHRLIAWLYGGLLFTLPWVGCDPVHLCVGGDLGAGFQPAYLLLAVVVCLSCVPRPGSVCRAVWRFRPWSWLLLACLAATLLSGAGLDVSPPGHALAPRLLRFLKQCLQLAVMLTFTIFTCAWTRGAARWRWTQTWLGAGMIFQLAYGAAQAACFPVGPPWFAALERLFTSNPAILAGSEELYVGQAMTGLPRLRGTACEPLYLGNYLLLVVPVLLLPGGRRSRPVRHVVAFGAVMLLIWTWSRGAYLAAVVASLTACVLLRRAGLRPRPRRRTVFAVAACAGIGILCAGALFGSDALLLPGRRLAQSLNQADWSNLTRLYSMQAAWRTFLMSPVVGVGWGQFAYHFPWLVDPAGLQSQFNWPVVNNFPLQILCETGIAGLAVAGVSLIVLLRAVWAATAWPPAGGGTTRAATVLPVVASATAVSGVWSQLLTFSQYNLPHIWVALGLLVAALAEARQASEGSLVAAAAGKGAACSADPTT